MLSLCAAGASAPSKGDDNTELIEMLSKRGMTALLDRLIETDPPTDTVQRRQLDTARARLELRRIEKQRDDAVERGDGQLAAALNDRAGEASEALLSAQRELIEDPALVDRPEQVVWRTDLAEMLLFDRLRGRLNFAPAFVEFGVPTAAQLDALRATVPEALALTADSERRVDQLRRFYGENADARQRDQANQRYYRLMEDYGQRRTPFLHATAMHLSAVLLDRDAAQAGGDALPGGTDDPAAERQRLLRGAAERLETLYEGDPGAVESAARSRLGRVLIAMGRADAGIDDHLDPMITNAVDGLPGVSAALGKAAALREMGRFPSALETLDEASRLEAVAASPMLRLLVTDARFLTLAARTDTEAGRAAAYDVYFEMLREPAVRASASALRALIYQRWADALSVGQDVSGLSPAVRMAVGQSARETGQRAKLVEQDAEKADRYLRWSVRVNETLAGEGLSDAVRASGLFNAALASVLLSEGDVETLIGAVRSWTEVADRYPREPMAEQAATYAADYATALVQQAPDHPDVSALYQAAMDVLFGRYDETDAAGKHRLYYAFRVFQQRGQHERAAQEYARVPFGHEQYFEAQSLRLFNLRRAYELTPPDQTDLNSGRKLRDARRQIAAGAAEQVEFEAKKAASAAGNEQEERRARRAEAAAGLALAATELDAGDSDAALSRLVALSERFAAFDGHADTRRDIDAKRIVTLVAAGRYDDASTAAQGMMSRFPDAAAGVIGNVLRDLEQRVTALRAEADATVASEAGALRDKAATLAGVTATLANLLVSWGDARDLEPDAMLGYELPYVRALRVAGRPQEAWQFLSDRAIVTGFPNHLDVLQAAGETLYAVGVQEEQRDGRTHYTVTDDTAARDAVPYFDRLITGLQPPYPEAYWNAWLRRLSLNVALRMDVARVPLRIRQLEQAHPELGGPAFADRFLRLADDARRVLETTP